MLEKLKVDMEGADKLASIKFGSDIVVKYAPLLPAETLEPTCALIKSATVKHFTELRSKCAASDAGDTLAELEKFSRTMHDVALAFPTDDWANDMLSEVGAFMAKASEKDFNGEMVKVAAAMKSAFEAGEMPAPESLQALRKIVAQARAKVHFQGEKEKQAIVGLMQAAVGGGFERISTEWLTALSMVQSLGLLMETYEGSSEGRFVDLCCAACRTIERVELAAPVVVAPVLPKQWTIVLQTLSATFLGFKERAMACGFSVNDDGTAQLLENTEETVADPDKWLIAVGAVGKKYAEVVHGLRMKVLMEMMEGGGGVEVGVVGLARRRSRAQMLRVGPCVVWSSLRPRGLLSS